MMEVRGFYNIAHEETYHDGDIIFEEGKSGDWVYIVLSGSVEVYKTISGSKSTLSLRGGGGPTPQLPL